MKDFRNSQGFLKYYVKFKIIKTRTKNSQFQGNFPKHPIGNRNKTRNPFRA